MAWIYTAIIILFFGLPMLGQLIIEFGLDEVKHVAVMGFIAWLCFA